MERIVDNIWATFLVRNGWVSDFLCFDEDPTLGASAKRSNRQDSDTVREAIANDPGQTRGFVAISKTGTWKVLLWGRVFLFFVAGGEYESAFEITGVHFEKDS